MNTTTLYLSEPFKTLWAGQDPFLAASTLTGRTVRDLSGRCTLRFELNGKAYYLKRQQGLSWKEILDEFIRLRRPILGASNEWHAINACHALNISTMTAVACGERGTGPARKCSFLITEAIEPAIDLDQYTRNWSEKPPAIAHKRALIEKVATIARRLHEGGINHRDFYLCHFLLRTCPDGESASPHLALIDLHRAQIRPRTPARWLRKDLSALYFSALDIGLTRNDKLRFLRTYFPSPLRQTLKNKKALLFYLEKEAARLKLRYKRKFAHLPDLKK